MAVPSSFFGSSSGGSTSPSSFFSGGGGGRRSTAYSTAYTPPATPESTAKKQQLAAVARLANGTDQDKRMAQRFLEDNQQLYTDEELAEYGLEKPGKDDRSLWEKAKGSAIGAVQATMGVVSRPQQFVANALRTGGSALAVGAYGLSQGDVPGAFREAGEELSQGGRDTARSITDIKGEHDINTREMLNLDKGAGGSGWFGDYVVGGLDTAGAIVTDPLSWVSMGTAGAASAGFKAAETAAARGLVRAEVPTLLRTSGRKALLEGEEQAIRDVALEMAQEAGAGQRGRLATKFFGGESEAVGGPIRRLKEGAIRDVARDTAEQTGRLNARYWTPSGTGLRGAERVAENNVNALLARGQRGLKFGGQTVLSSAKYRAPLEARGILNARPLVDNPALEAARAERDNIAAQMDKLTTRIAEAEESKTAWSSKSSEALPGAQAELDRLKQEYQTLAQRLQDADPDVYVPPTQVPNPDLPRANQDYLRHDQALRKIDADAAKLDEEDKVLDAQRRDLEAQLANLEKSKLNFQLKVADQFDPIRPSVVNDAVEQTQMQIDSVRAQLDELDELDDIPDRRMTLEEEYERIAQLQDEAATTPETVYQEGRLEANPELDTRARRPSELDIPEPEAQPDGSFDVRAFTSDGKPAGSVNYYLDQDGVVQIEGAMSLQKRKGVMRELLGKVEEATGQHRSTFEPGSGVMPGAEDWWADVKATPVDAPAKPASATRKSLAAQTQEAERAMNRAQRQVDRLTKRVGVTSEKQVARAEGKLERLAARHAELEAKLAGLDERMPRMPGQVEDFIPSRIPGATKAQTTLRRAFVTGSRVADEHGQRAAQAIKNLRELALGSAESSSNAAVRRLRNVFHEAAAEDRTFLNDLPKIYRSIETGNADELAMQFADEGRGKAADAIRTLTRMNAEDTAAMVDEGFLPEEFLSTTGGAGGYMKRVETPKAAKARRETQAGTRRGSPARPASMFKADADMGSAHARTSHVGEVLDDDLQAALASERGLPEGTKVIEDNPFLSVGQHRTELEHARAHREFIKQASEVYDEAGLPLVTQDSALAKTHGYVSIPTPEGGNLWAPPAIAEEVGRFQDVVFNDESIKAFGQVMDKTMRIWKAHATVPLIGLAFHARNAQTNMLLNWIAGVENPVWYARSAKAQLKIEKAMKALGADADFDTALAKSGLTAKEQKAVKLAQQHNVLTSSQASIDLADQGGYGIRDQLSERTAEPGLRGRAKRTPSKFNPFSPEHFVGTTTGRMVSGGLENNARLAHFMWALDKYGDAETAAQSVKKYLFNYADLTPFERRVMKRVIPFYTFMRKNTALVARTAFEDPGKMSRFAKLQSETEDNTGAPTFLQGELIPGYVTEMGQAPRKAPGLGGLTASIESPWSAAAETLAPVGEIAGMTPVANRFVPDEFKGKGPEETALKLLNIPGGPVAEALKYTAERALGKDTYTGGDVRTMNPLGEVLRVTDIFAPSPSKAVRLHDKFFQGDLTGKHTTPAQGDERTRRRAATVINALFGLNTNAIGPQATEAEVTRRFYELADYIDVRNRDLPATLEDGSPNPARVPTIEELRDAGILPSGRQASGYQSGY